MTDKIHFTNREKATTQNTAPPLILKKFKADEDYCEVAKENIFCQLDDLSTRLDVARQLIEASWKEPELKEKLIDNPKESLQEVLHQFDTSFHLPEYLKVKFIEELPGEIIFVLPQNPEDEILSEEQLALASGGIASGMKWIPKIPPCSEKTIIICERKAGLQQGKRATGD